jgi:hypothetical protein
MSSGGSYTGLADRVAVLRAPTRSDPETERWLLFQAVAHFLQVIAAERRVLLVIDDLHWAEPATLLLLRHLSRASIERLFVVATARTAELAAPDAFAEALADLAREHLLDTITLHGLNDNEVAALITDRLGVPADFAFAQATRDETGGNPFFVHELISHLANLGILAEATAMDWPTAAQIEQSGAPQGVRHVLARRIGRLSASAREMLVMAAVVGGEFQAIEVATVAGHRRDALSCLEEAVASGLISETGRSPGAYRFAHALVRHTLYDSIPGLRRAELHWRLAEAIRGGGPVDRRLNQLAYHYRHSLPAGDPAVAVRWLRQAADQAARQVAFEEAIEHYRAALAALDLCPDDPDCRYKLLAGLAESADAISDFNLAAPVWLAAAEIARTAQDSARFLRAVVGYGGPIRGEVADPSYGRLIEEGLELTGAADSGERAQLLAWRASTFYQGSSWRPPEERERTIRDALDMAQRVGDRSAHSWVLVALAQLLTASSRPTELLAVSKEHLHLLNTAGVVLKKASI